MSEYRVHPEVAAGDPFTVESPRHRAGAIREDHPHCCNDGWVSIGNIVVDEESEAGEESIEYALYLCRRCKVRSGK